MIKLGYSLGSNKQKYSLKDKIKIISSVETHAVELSYMVIDELKEKPDEEDIELLKKFQYISIHAPALVYKNQETGEKKWIRYPDDNSQAVIMQLLEIAKKINANTILFHPDLVDDFSWLAKQIGSLLSFENMDKNKKFGNNIKDLEKIFSQAPNAKWVCDVNHIYTVDQSMKLSQKFHDAFGDRLCHYHLSAYGGFHEAFYISGEDIILQGIKNFSIPIIHEGQALRDGKESLIKENKYVLERLEK
ncbi:MAG: hypothetical protein JW816_03900 [Candidatus Buchananbacteria bacterium]|nr:hypothetical protein [Candidatus Buchananbacteria bacterium]